jgi:hypothetical protein
MCTRSFFTGVVPTNAGQRSSAQNQSRLST